MFVLYESPELYQTYATVSKRYSIPFLATTNLWARGSSCEEVTPADTLLFAVPEITPDAWNSAYCAAIKNLNPGISVMLVHLGFDDDELASISGKNSEFGSAWRQRDYDLVMSAEFKNELQENRVKLIGWRDWPGTEYNRIR